MSSSEGKRVHIAIASSGTLKDLISDAVAQSVHDFEVVAHLRTADAALEACQTQKVDILVLHTQTLNGRPIGELKKLAPMTRFLLSFGLIADEDILSAINAGVDGVVADTCSTADFAAALDRLASGMNYFCARSSRVLVRAARGITLTSNVDNSRLTRREKDVLLLVAAGRTNKEIASLLDVSCATVDTHRRNVMCKLGTHNAADLVRYCYSQGWLRC